MAELTGFVPRDGVSQLPTTDSILQACIQHTHAHIAESRQTRPPCGSGKQGTYNVSLHVYGLLLILFVSSASCAFPILVKLFPKLRVPHYFLFLARHFGTGVLIATAFVHLLPTAFGSLTDPCLPSFWNETYPAMPGFVAMLAVFAVVCIEMFFAMRGVKHVHAAEFEGYADDSGDETEPSRLDANGNQANASRAKPEDSGTANNARRHERPPPIHIPSDGDEEAQTLLANRSPTRINSPNSPDTPDSPGSSSPETTPYSPTAIQLTSVAPEPSNPNSRNQDHPHSPRSTSPSPPPTKPPPHPDPRALLQVLLLEFGILFHSIFIGMAISVTPAPQFYVLLAAITFHQVFEGLALGARISALSFAARSPHPWLMALAFGTTAPLGQALGLALHSAYDPASAPGLVSVGVMNAVSAGLLLYAGLVELLAEDFLSEASYAALRGRRRAQAMMAVGAGAGMMAAVGAFA